MTEINGNIPNFGLNAGKVEPKKGKETLVQKNNENNDQDKKASYIQDTGILGRSQVMKTRGGDITKSVDEAVNIAEKNPALLCGCETLFNDIYKDFIEQGMDETDAYMNALIAEEEFLQIGAANNR